MFMLSLETSYVAYAVNNANPNRLRLGLLPIVTNEESIDKRRSDVN